MTTVNGQVAAISSEGPRNQTPETGMKFRWAHIALPLALLAVSIVLAAVFYGSLPAELSYRFGADAAVYTFGRGAFLAWTLVPQLLLALLAFGLVRLALLSLRSLQPEDTPMPKVLMLMGNMMGIPQIVLTYAMLDIIIYNIYQTKLLSLWLFACIILVAGGVVLTVFFFKAFREARRLQASNLPGVK